MVIQANYSNISKGLLYEELISLEKKLVKQNIQLNSYQIFEDDNNFQVIFSLNNCSDLSKVVNSYYIKDYEIIS